MAAGAFHLAGMALVLLLVAAVGAYSGTRVAGATDFTTGGGKAGSLLVAGTIMGTLVSSQSTVGTAQLAFIYGMSAWWYTLGAGAGCLILAGFAPALRTAPARTLTGVIAAEYGGRCAYLASVLSSLGIFISVFSQVVAFAALTTTVLPVPLGAGAGLAVAAMAAYVLFGGVWGAGMAGLAKLALLYAAAIACGLLVLALDGGPAGMWGRLADTLAGTGLGKAAGAPDAAALSARYGSLFARGAPKDIGAGLSVILGILSTQTYASALWAAKSTASARRGALLSACLIPPIGMAGILVGLFMRGRCITAAEAAALEQAGQEVPEGLILLATTAQVFPAFVAHCLPPVPAGLVLGTLLITIVGGGAGLSLGVATIITNDIVCRLTRRFGSARGRLLLARLTIVAVLLASAALATLMPAAIINEFGYLSMGLRAAVVLLPLCGGLWLAGRVPAGYALAAIIASPLAVLAGGLYGAKSGPMAADPLFAGLLAGAGIMGAGLLRHAAGRRA